jgi:acyl-CoA hydrolase
MSELIPVDPDVSRTEMTWIVMPSQANALNTVFGGQVMAWIDVCAAVAAQRYAGCDVVTAGMDGMTFLGPIRQGDIVVVRGMVNQAWRTSMEVGVRVEREDPHTRVRVKTSSAYLTFVALGAEGEPQPVAPLRLLTDEHRRRAADAEVRRAARLRLKQEMLERRAQKG